MRRWRLRALARLALVAAVLGSGAAQARQAAIVVDAATGAVLEAHEATQLWYPASLTKMMTIFLAFEAVDAGRIGLDDMLTVSPHAAGQPETRLGLVTGQRISLRDAILALITRSANDAAVAIGEQLAGSESEFAQRMTAKARELGMERTVFRNASGLPDPDQRTTARDLAMLALALRARFPQHYAMFSARQMRFRGRVLPTINGILVSYPGADGIKTGFTCGSGYNLVASAARDGKRVVAVLLGSLSRSGRAGDMTRLLDKGFARLVHESTAELDVSTLTDFIDVIDSAPPPRQLDTKDCAVTTASAIEKTPAQLPLGFGLTLGSYPTRAAARSALDRARARLKAIIASARPAIVAQQRASITTYAAVLAGLSQAPASTACTMLRAAGDTCLVITPAVLGNASAILWRPR